MAMVGVDLAACTGGSQPKLSGLVLGRRQLGAVLHSSNELGELSQWLCHDDSTINIVLDSIIIIMWCKLAKVDHGARALNDQLWGQEVKGQGHVKPN